MALLDRVPPRVRQYAELYGLYGFAKFGIGAGTTVTALVLGVVEDVSPFVVLVLAVFVFFLTVEGINAVTAIQYRRQDQQRGPTLTLTVPLAIELRILDLANRIRECDPDREYAPYEFPSAISFGHTLKRLQQRLASIVPALTSPYTWELDDEAHRLVEEAAVGHGAEPKIRPLLDSVGAILLPDLEARDVHALHWALWYLARRLYMNRHGIRSLLD